VSGFGQLDLQLGGERRITRQRALLWVLYRLDAEGHLRKGRDISTPDDAWLIGWSDEPGDPVFVAVGEEFHQVLEAKARRLATAFMRTVDAEIAEPNFFIPPCQKK